MFFIRFGFITAMVVGLTGANFAVHPKTIAAGARLSVAAVAATPQQQTAAKIGQFLERLGGSYTKVSDAVWSVPFQGKASSKYDVLVVVAPNSTLLVAGVIVAEKKDISLSQDLLYRLLKFNHSADYVKVGFDDEDTLFVRAEMNGQTMDFQSFEAVISQVAAAADQVYGLIKADMVVKP